jgi:acetyl esterase
MNPTGCRGRQGILENVDHRLDPKIQAILEVIEQQGGPALETLPVAEARRLAGEGLKPYQGDPEAVAGVENRSVPVPVRIYTPAAPAPRPALVYFHGGGWVVCDLDTHDVVCRAIANRSGAVVVSVDYRLAPEHPFPAAVEDCYAVVCWVAEHAGDLGVDARRIAVGGDSAGGNLGAVISLKARDEGGPRIARQVLVYPVTNLASFDTPSYKEFAQGYHLTTSEMEWFRDCYLAQPEDGSNAFASPLLAAELSGLPPALVITAECDVLRDEGEAYARRLEQAGVPVKAIRYAGMIHPFFSMPGAVPQARDAIEQVGAFIRGE